eukprot:14791881-Ditylum_brightwellii.AAC.2
MEHNHDYLSNILEPNLDAIKQCANMLYAFENIMTLKHVKGHQENNTNCNALDVSARLNADADILTNKHRISNKNHLKEGISSPANTTYLNIGNAHLNSKYFKIIRSK